MVVIVSEPDSSDLLNSIGKHVSYDVRFRVGIRRDICDAVKEFYDTADTEDPQDQDIHAEMRDIQSELRTEKSDEFVPYEEEEKYQGFEEIEAAEED